MSARHIVALLKSHLHGDEGEFFSVAMEVAAREARLGHIKVADQIRRLIDDAKRRSSQGRDGRQLLLLQPRTEIASLLTVREPAHRLSDLILDPILEKRLRRILLEYRQRERLLSHGLTPRRKLLFVGPPGTGKTLTAAALAGELHIPLFTAQLEGIITKFMGETAAKLKVVFDSMTSASGVYFFDEFDALGAKRSALNDVGEVRRILNSFLQLLEGESSSSLIVAATNHPELLDQALYRRFDDVLEYSLPNESQREVVLRTRLSSFDLSETAWEKLLESTRGLSHAELVRAAEDAAKSAILRGNSRVTTKDLQVALEERKYTRP